MNKELLDSMRKQMNPSPDVRAALAEKLAQSPAKRPVPWKRYTALAACAVLMVGVYAVYQAGKPHDQPLYRTVQLHSYVTVEGGAGYATENTSVTQDEGEELYTTGVGVRDSEEGDQDMDMTPEDLTSAMLDVDYTQEEIDEYQSIGYQMTWAKWWKFVGEQRNSEGDAPFSLATLKAFSQRELLAPSGAQPAPNTGDLPGGAYVGDVPVQEGAEDYQRLMDHFDGVLPDWYGGAYLDPSGRLVVQLAESQDPGDKSLELQVLDWTGSDSVMFSSCKYSLNQLNELMDRLNALPDADTKCGDVMAGWGVDEENNRIELTLTQVNDHILSVLAELDPEDDMILVQVGQRATLTTAEGEDPAVRHAMPGGTVPEDDRDLIAYEPVYDGAHYDLKDLPAELPEQKLPAVAERDDMSTPSYDPQA